jgi:16S rRNA (adenine1518-N6/adenine1519-N6)-dimethyltransferase
VAHAKRRLGQHFLSDPTILRRIADALAPAAGDTVLEIGPGPGGLTAALRGRSARLVAIEKDPDLVPALRARFPDVEVVEGDALEIDWREAAGVGAGELLVVGNIPYNITSPLLDRALTPPRPARIVFLVQKEVAERVAAEAGTSEYGALTVGVQAAARVERLFTVSARAFQPVPKVDSAVLRLVPLERPLVPDGEVWSFRRMVVGLFGFRRKQLLRGLRELTGWPADRLAPLLAAAGIEATARPETLSPARFAELHAALVDGGWRAG